MNKHKRYRERHAEKIKIARAARHQRTKHTPEAIARRKRHKVRRRGLMESRRCDLTASQWTQILASYEYRCAYCAETGMMTQDHVLAISKGGEHTASNVVPACVECNMSKRTAYAPDALCLNPYYEERAA